MCFCACVHVSRMVLGALYRMGWTVCFECLKEEQKAAGLRTVSKLTK